MPTKRERQEMVDHQIAARGVTQQAVLDAMRDVPREAFITEEYEDLAYADRPLPIAEGQTISQPYIVALMVEALDISKEDTVLEVGAGSGYAAAILGQVARQVYAIERHEELAKSARETIGRLGYPNIEIRHGDGTQGFEDKAPFDAILVSAGGSRVPEPLIEQLADGGRLIIPVGSRHGQELVRLQKKGDELERTSLGGARFVPLVGA